MKSGERQNAPQPQRGMGRMVVVSAAVHALVIVLIVLIASHHSSESHSGLTAYTVELVNPGVLGPTKGGGKSSPAPSREEPAKTQVKETPPPKQQATSKEVEPPKPKEPPAAKAPKPPKVAAVTPPPQEPPVVKPKPPEATKPTDAVKLPEKSKKAEPNPQPKPTIEPAKTTEKSIPPKKSDNKIEKNQEKKLTETTQKSEKPAPAPQKSETSSAANAKERKTEEREERTTEEREKQILAAMERVRAAEEAARREQGIAAAVDRVRQKVPDKGEGNPSNHETPRSARQNGETDGKRVDGGNPGGGYGAEFLAYTQHIKQRVKEAWIVTERKPGLSAVVRFGVDTTGEVLEVELAESSGDRAFDQTVLRAVRKANPLPPPPEAYREEFLTQKVEITFSGEERIK